MKLKKLPIIQLLIQSVLFLITAVPIMAQQNQYFGPKTHDLYAFRSPDDTNTVTIIATFSALQSPQDGLNYPSFDPNTRYEIHIENDGTSGDDITYRFKFNQTNQDPTTFFLVRLGQQNYATTYTLESSINNGPFTTIVNNGIVPAVNIGDRSVSDPTVGLGASNYNSLINSSITSTSGGGGETVFCGHADDPFFMDLGGFADLGSTGNGTGPSDGYGRKNVMAITLKIPISTLQKNGLPVTAAVNILDADFIIGLWSSTSVQEFRTLNTNGTQSNSGSWIQVSRVGMPLTNTLIIPVGFRDTWNSLTPYNENPISEDYISNPELGLYMDNSLFGGAFPNWSALRIQRNTLQSFDFGNTHDGLWPIRATNGGAGTAVDTNLFGNYLLRQGKPRSFDLLPLFHTGIPNLAPYQLATGKNGNPLAIGKPFLNNFLPTFGDMLRLNMAVPVTDRNDPQFSSLGVLKAAELGITQSPYNTNSNLELIPNMDGFPNGRRLEDDVVRINMQLASGIFLAHIGFWYDDYTAGGPAPLTTDYNDVRSFTTQIESNDTTFKTSFPYLQAPWVATANYTLGGVNTIPIYDTITIQDTVLVTVTDTLIINTSLGLNPPNDVNTIKVYPNPASDHLFIDNGNYAIMSQYSIKIINSTTQEVFSSPINQQLFDIDLSGWTGTGIYFLQLYDGSNNLIDIRKVVIN